MKIHGKSSLFQKVHLRLTLLFTGIAGLILVILSVSYLLMSEKEWRDYSYLAFLRESETIVSNLAQQKTINQRWLSDITENNHYFLAVYDNGTPLTSTDTVLDDAHKELADRFLAIATTDFSAMSTDANHTTLHTDFSYRTKADITYDIYAARLGTRKTPLCAVIFSPTTELEERLSNERLRFLLIDIFGILFLFLFSYFYTKKLLSPIQENQKQQTEFLSAASHELRTPLAAMLSSLSAWHSADAAMQKQFIDMFEHESRRMASLVNDMLSLTRADNHTWSFSMKKTELDTLLLNTYEAFLPLAKEHGCTLSIKLPEDVIPLCVCDEERIEQVLFILLNNAVSYGISDKVPSVSLTLSFFETEFRICVIDHGCGIPAESKQHIFDRFYRADASRSTQEHFGLGLCIAKEIMDAHHGKIEVSDTDGGGSTFCLRLKHTK